MLVDKMVRVVELASKEEVPWLSRASLMDITVGMVLEKAYSKLMAVQSPPLTPHLSTVLRDMTGLEPEYFCISTCKDAPLFYHWVGFCLEMGCFVGLVTHDKKVLVVDSL